VFLGACGGGGGVSVDNFFDKLADAECVNQVKCGGMPDDATCHEALSTDGNDIETLIARVKAKEIVFDSKAATACINQFKNESCAFEGFFIHNPCADVFTGAGAMGDACNIDFDCAGLAACNLTDMNCDPTTACCAGTCGADATISQVGGPCNDGTNICDETLYCKPSATGTGTDSCAVPVATMGTACDSIDGCANPMFCDLAAASPTCQTGADLDGTCNPMLLLPCQDFTQFCDTGTMKCTDNVAPGGTCDGDGTGTGASCVGFASCTNNSCVANAGLGDTCNDTNGPSCLGSLTCTSGACVAAPAGVACN
jgi:hypothetical protein